MKKEICSVMANDISIVFHTGLAPQDKTDTLLSCTSMQLMSIKTKPSDSSIFQQIDTLVNDNTCYCHRSSCNKLVGITNSQQAQLGKPSAI